MSSNSSNPLLSTSKASDSGLRILLHPLILLTISDYITRHVLRRHEGPIVGALIGQQHGREISLEHAFEIKMLMPDGGGEIMVDDEWFRDRLQQYKDVHKDPALDLVGWFTTAPVSGPQVQHAAIQRQIMSAYNESVVMLAFHPGSIVEGATSGGKLPLTIYESVYEQEKSGESQPQEEEEKGKQAMWVDGADKALNFKFQELLYTVETGQAEMISIDFVARGGGNATAIEDAAAKKASKSQSSQKPVVDVSPAKEVNGTDDSSILSGEDEEFLASLTTRANAVKMLHARLALLKSYLASLPPCYLNTPPPTPTTPTQPPHHPTLRSISSLLHRLPLLTPPGSALALEKSAERADVELVSLLGTLGRSIKDAREMGRKFGVVEGARVAGAKKGGDLFGGSSAAAAGGRFGGDGGGFAFGEEGIGGR